MAVTLVSVAAVHSRTLAEVGLQHKLATSPTRELLNLQLILQDRPLGRQDYDRLDSVAGEAVQDHLGWLSSGLHRFGRTEFLPFVRSEEAPLPARGFPTAYPFFQEGFQDHARLVSGRWPQESQVARVGDLLLMEGVVGAEAARDLGLSTDMTIYLVPFRTAPQERVAITIVGIVEPLDTEDLYWFRDLSRFRLALQDGADVVPLYVGETAFFDGMGVRYPMLLGTYYWYVSLDVESLTAGTASQASQALDALEKDVNRRFPRALMITTLSNLISEYQRDVSLARVPLFLFMSLVTSVVLYFLVLITVMLSRDRGAEAAMMRSRGASVLQVGAILGLGEGVAIALPAVLLGPFLGWLIAGLLTTGDAGLGQVSAKLSPSVFAAAGVAGLVAVAVFLASGMGIARRGIVQFLRERTRLPQRPALYRYAIDLLALVAMGLVWYQARGRGGFLTERLLGGGLEADLSLMLAPALVLLAAALILLRALPIALRLVAESVSPTGVLWLVHGLKRMARDPLQHGTLAILVMLATSLGVFGATFGATLTQSQGDQARYAVGGELVVTPPKLNLADPTKERSRILVEVPGVRRVANVYRSEIAAPGGGPNGEGYTLLAVDPSNLSSVAWFREDFADEGLRELLAPLMRQPSIRRRILLPEGTDRLGAWVRVERSQPSISLWARLGDSFGQYESVSLGNLAASGWTYLDAPLPEETQLEPPVALSGLHLSSGQFTGQGGGSVALDDVTAVVGGEATVLEGFETDGPWTRLPNLGIAPDTLVRTDEAAHSGRAGALFTWTEAMGGASRGLVVPIVPLPLPAIGSAGFHLGQELVGRLGDYPLGVSVDGVAEFFPTLYPGRDPFLIVSLDHLNGYLGLLRGPRAVRATEFWVGLQDDADRAQTIGAIQEILTTDGFVRDRGAMAQQAERSPLAGGAWSGLALLAAVAIGAVVTIGFALYAGLSVKRARVELGVLQAIGFSRWQVGKVLALEGMVVAGIGAAVGVATGLWMGRWTLGYLEITSGGQPIVPPMTMVTSEWLAIVALAMVAVGVVLATLLALVLALRLRVHEVLRVEE